MRKLLAVMCFVVVVLVLSSCERTCTCKTYRDGVMIDEATSDMPDGVNSCSDMDIYVETENGVIRETKCN